MRILSYIRAKVPRIFTMVKRKLTFSVRLSPIVVKEIDHLVDTEVYSSRSDLVSRAVHELLQRESMRPIVKDEIRSFLLSPEGRSLLKGILKEE